MEIHEHRFLLLGLRFPRILRGFLCLSMSAPQPFVIGFRRWPQTWRRAVFINTDGSAEFAGTSTTAPFKRPAKHGAFGETTATGDLSTRAASQEFLSHLVVEALGPLCTCAEGLALLPGSVLATSALKAPHMQPQHGGTLQDGQVAHAPRSALFYAGAARLASGTHDGVRSAFEMQRKLFGAKHLIDDAKFW